MKPVSLTINGHPQAYSGEPDQPLLWYLRDTCDRPGTKVRVRCRINCGACAVHMDSQAVRSCFAANERVEASALRPSKAWRKTGNSHAMQQAWIGGGTWRSVAYCQAGQIMAVVDLLRENPTERCGHPIN